MKATAWDTDVRINLIRASDVRSKMPNVPPVRYHDLDLLRAGLMLLGIVYHAALLFGPEGAWRVVAPTTSLGYTIFADTLHAWRMPAFFVIAGFFAVLMVDRRGPRAWIIGRLQRLGLPLLFGLFVVVPISIFIRNYVRLGSRQAATDEWFRKLLLPGGMVEHLWFLIALLLFCAVFAAVAQWPRGRRVAKQIADKAADLSQKRWGPLLAAVGIGFCVAAALGLWRMGHVELVTWGLISYHTAYYAPFFVAGAVIASREDLRLRFTSRPSAVTWAVAIASCLSYAVSAVLPSVIGVQIIRAVVVTVAGLYGARVLFWLAGRIMTQGNVVVTWLTSTAMLIYILHQPVLLVTALAVFQADVPPIFAFLAVVAATFVVTALLAEALMVWRPLRFLTTGTTKRGTSLSALFSRRVYPREVGR